MPVIMHQNCVTWSELVCRVSSSSMSWATGRTVDGEAAGLVFVEMSILTGPVLFT